MKSLVIFDSQYGNTAQIAVKIADTLAQFGEARAERVTAVQPDMLEGVQLLVVGGPTQGWNSTAAVKDFLVKLTPAQLEALSAAEFDTRLDKPRWLTGSAANNIAKQLRSLGANLLLKPESFLVKGTEGPLVEGELERAARWAQQLQAEFENQAHPIL